MTSRSPDDGPTVAVGADRYDTIGVAYSSIRREEPTWRRAIAGALGHGTVLNVGAGTGNYEPSARDVVAVEPSEVMLVQRPHGAAPAVQAVAESLPFADGSFDVGLAILTVHHWADPALGLRELARVARRQVVVTWDPDASARFWLHRDYLPELVAFESRLSSLRDVVGALEVRDVVALDVPRDCADGFLGTHFDDPAWYLDPGVHLSMSGLALLDATVVRRALEALRTDVEDGSWFDRNRELAGRASFDAGFRLVIAGDWHD